MNIDLPLGARIAAERAYADMPREHRNDPAHVAEVILLAAAPFMAPVVAQLGRTRVTETAAADIFRHWLAGKSPRVLSSQYAVSDTTIKKYVRRGVERSQTRIVAGTPASVIAAENQVSVAALLAALDLVGGRRGA